MEVDYIIAGQGICGTILSWHLLQRGKTVMVFDMPKQSSASRVASGLINPISGMRLVKMNRFDEMSGYASKVYTAIGDELATDLFHETDILHFHENAEIENIYHKKSSQGSTYFHTGADDAGWRQYFSFAHGVSQISPCYLVDLNTLLDVWQGLLEKTSAIRQERFDWNLCQPGIDSVQYKDIIAEKVICCDGAEGLCNPYFTYLPFTQNKGEALIASIPDLYRGTIYKKDGLHLIPWKDKLFWAGSSFERNFTDLFPSEQFRRQTVAKLNAWLRVPWEIADHIAAQRPATIDRMPFAGCDATYPSVAIFNGMGTKGCMYAPSYGKAFTSHLLDGEVLPKEIDINRFGKKGKITTTELNL